MRMFLMVMAVVALVVVAANAQADCSGSQAIIASCSGSQAIAASCSGAQAKPVRQRIGILARIRNRAKSACNGSASVASCSGSIRTTITTSIVVPVAMSYSGNSDNDAIAYAKSVQQANSGQMGHVGGSFGTGRYEGVGMSSRSAQDAIQRACYYGIRPIVGQSVVQGGNGNWYATVLYN